MALFSPTAKQRRLHALCWIPWIITVLMMFVGLAGAIVGLIYGVVSGLPHDQAADCYAYGAAIGAFFGIPVGCYVGVRKLRNDVEYFERYGHWPPIDSEGAN